MQKLTYISLMLFSFFLPISNDLSLLFSFIMLLIWLKNRHFQKDWDIIKKYPVLYLILLIWLATEVSAAFSLSYDHGFLSSGGRNLFKVIFLHYFIVPLVAIVIFFSFAVNKIEKAISIFIGSVLASTAISYLIFFRLIDIGALKENHILRQTATYTDPSPFMNHILFSVFLAITSILLLDRLTKCRSIIRKVFYSVSLLLVSMDLFLVQGRAGQLAYTIAIAIYLLSHYGLKVKGFILTISFLCTTLLGAYSLSPTFSHRANLAMDEIKKTSNHNYISSVGIRIAMNKASLLYLTSSPERFIFGAGAGDSREEYLKIVQKYFDKDTSRYIATLPNIHNQYLQFWLDGTIISLILFLAYLYFLLKIPICNKYRALLNAFSSIVLLVTITNNQLYSYQSGMLFMLLTSFFVSLSYRTEKAQF